MKIQPHFESHGTRFSGISLSLLILFISFTTIKACSPHWIVCAGNVSLRKAQLARVIAETESLGDVDELRVKFIGELEALLDHIKNMNLNYDIGLIHATLAKTYLRCIFLYSVLFL